MQDAHDLAVLLRLDVNSSMRNRFTRSIAAPFSSCSWAAFFISRASSAAWSFFMDIWVESQELAQQTRDVGLHEPMKPRDAQTTAWA